MDIQENKAKGLKSIKFTSIYNLSKQTDYSLNNGQECKTNRLTIKQL